MHAFKHLIAAILSEPLVIWTCLLSTIHKPLYQHLVLTLNWCSHKIRNDQSFVRREGVDYLRQSFVCTVFTDDGVQYVRTITFLCFQCCLPDLAALALNWCSVGKINTWSLHLAVLIDSLSCCVTLLCQQAIGHDIWVKQLLNAIGPGWKTWMCHLSLVWGFWT